MNREGGTISREDRRWSWGVSLAGAVLFLLTALVYIEPRGYFEDETAQVGGLRLGPARVVEWLTSGRPQDYGTTLGDRMPPLSYWVGWIWTRGFGLNEAALRGLSILMAALAVLIVGRAASRWIGSAEGATAALVLGLSPFIAAEGADIRPYPQFLLLSALSVALWVRALRSAPEATPRWVAMLAATLFLCFYTHFFGVVLAAGLLGSGFLIHLRGRGSIRPWLVAGAVTGTSSLGLLPFIRGSMELSRRADAAIGGATDAVGPLHAVVQPFLPPVVTSSPVLFVLGAGALAILCLSWLGLLIEAARRREWPRGLEVVLPLAIGWFFVVGVVARVSSHFQVFRPTYNLWSMPLIAIALVVPLTAAAGWVRRATRVGLAVLILVDLAAAVDCSRHRDWMDHGPDMAIRRAVQRRGPRETVLIHDHSPWFAFGAFPASLEFGGELRQYIADESGQGGVDVHPGAAEGVAPENLDSPSIAVLRLDHVSWRRLRGRSAGPIIPPMGPVASRLVANGWRCVEAEHRVVLGDAGSIWFLGVRLEVYERPDPQRGNEALAE